MCRQVLDIAGKTEIKAVLIGGSLLGMVRDGDFLPWDKDLDFAVFEDDIEQTLALEDEYRENGYECRVHRLGIRPKKTLEQGVTLIHSITSSFELENIEHCLIGGALLNLYRDNRLSNEIDTVGFVLRDCNEVNLPDITKILQEVGKVYKNCEQGKLKSLTLITGDWRFNFFVYIESNNKFGWQDLNCEHWFDKPLFPAQQENTGNIKYFSPVNPKEFLSARFGSSWRKPLGSKFTKGWIVGSMQLYKDGVMFDFIMHYIRGEKTYWFEPAANVISTLGFTPFSMKDTTAGKMRIPDHPEVFLEEHYPNWRVPVKEWNGAVDNPTIIDSDEAMQAINSCDMVMSFNNKKAVT